VNDLHGFGNTPLKQNF